MQPKVSVIIPTYHPNHEYCIQAIRSITDQTYKNMEIFLIDDSVRKESIEFLEFLSGQDSRIRLIHNKEKQGISRSLNIGLHESTGKYIFRMDDDDISRADRITRQVNFLESHDEVDILGAWAEKFGAIHEKMRSPLSDDEIKATLLIKNAIIHPTVAFRRDTIEKHNIEYKVCDQAEDYALWSDCLINCKKEIRFANLNQILLKYRIHEEQLTASKREEVQESLLPIYRSLLEMFKVTVSDVQLRSYKEAMTGKKMLEAEELLIVNRFFERIVLENKKNGLIDCKVLESVLCRKFMNICLHQYWFRGNQNVEMALAKLDSPFFRQRILYRPPLCRLHNVTSSMREKLRPFI